MAKQSASIQVSVCGTYMKFKGGYMSAKEFQGGVFRKTDIEYAQKCYTATFNHWYWANGAKHSARQLDFITKEEYFLLCQ